MATTDVSTLSGDATKWVNPNPDYVATVNQVGGADADNRPQTLRKMISMAIRTPVCVASVLDSGPDFIWIGHSLTMYPADVLSPTPFDNHAVILVGQHTDRTVPICLDVAAFERHTVRCQRTDVLRGNTMLTAVPPVLRSGPHGAGVADTDEIQARRVCLMPSSMAGLATSPPATGRYSYLGFWQTFLKTEVTSGDAGRVAAVAPLTGWWRTVCTAGGAAVAGHAVNPSPTCVASVGPGSPLDTAALTTWANNVIQHAERRMGVGGPVLTEAASVRGVGDTRTTMTETHDARLQFERDRDNKTSADKHGGALAQRLMNLVEQDNGADFPEVHKLLVKSTKSREYGVLQSLSVERAVTSTVPLTANNAPLATTTLVDDVFRAYQPGGSGLISGQGLSPSPTVCEGHKEAAAAQRRIKDATLVEAGTSLSLGDASTLTAKFHPPLGVGEGTWP